MKTNSVITEPVAGVSYDPDTLARLVMAGKCDPEIGRMMERDAILRAEGLVMARAVPAVIPPGVTGTVPAGEPVAAAPYPATVAHPLSAPSFTGTELRIDTALKQPTRITRMVMDLTLQRFFVDRAFTSAGGVTGGAVIYDEMVANDLYADRDVERVAPGQEFPLVTFSRRAPRVAEVEKWGGKFFFTDEARDRNEVTQFVRAVRQLSNTIVRKLNTRGVEILNAVIAANSRTVIGNSWRTVVTTTTGQSNWTAMPARDFARAALTAETEELGIVYNLWIMNPNEWFSLQGIYGPDLQAALGSAGISIYVTNRITIGEAIVLAEGQVGEMRTEKPLGTETWRDPNGKEQTWIQSSVRPLIFADNPFAVLKFTGLNA